VLCFSLLLPCFAGVALAAGVTTVSGATAPSAQKAAPEGANGNAFSELSKGGESGGQEATQTQTTEKTTSNESSNKNSKKTIIVIVIAALVVLVVIGYVIARDARKNAPTTDPQIAEARSAHDTAAMMRKRRAKAKAARRARKTNR